MLGIKNRIKSFIEKTVDNYLKNKVPAKKEEGISKIDVSMAEAEKEKEKISLQEKLKLSFQKDFDSLSYVKGNKQYAMDSISNCIKDNKMVGMTGNPKDIVFSFFSQFGYIGWQICSVLAQHWLIKKACGIANKDCLRNGWNNIFVDKKDKNESEEEEKKSQEILNNLYDIEQQEFDLNNKLLEWGFFVNVYGVAFLLPKIDGIDYEQPYNPDGIKKGSFKGISVIEPYWMAPQFDLKNMVNPTDINFMQPEYYTTQDNQKIHKSHLIIGRRGYVSDILKPSYYFGGISLAQDMYERVYASEKSANEAPLLLLTKRLNVYRTKLKEVFANPQHYKDLMSVITEMRDNQGILFADLNDEVSQIDTTLSDLDEVIMKQYSLASAIAEVPVDKLFETNPTGGLSASGDYNIKNYNQNLNTLQTERFKPAIDRINEITIRSEFDRKDRVAIVFNPTDNPTEKEIADLNKEKSDMDISYIQAGVITPEEARQRIVNDKTSGYAFLKGVEKEEPTEEEQQDIEQMMKGAEEQQEGKDEAIVEDDRWVTLHPNENPDDYRKLLVENEESVKEAINRTYKKESKNGILTKKQEKIKEAKEVKTATTVEEAEKIGKELNLAGTINYNGIDVEYANAINNTTYKLLKKYPKLKEYIRNLGTVKGVNLYKQKKLFEEKAQEIEDSISRLLNGRRNYFNEVYGVYAEQKIKNIYGSYENMEKKIRKEIISSFKKAVSVKHYSKTWAYALWGLRGHTEKDGVYFNENYKAEELKESLKQCVEVKWHPEGCDTRQSIIDHELGHIIHRYIVDEHNKHGNNAYKQILSYRRTLSQQDIINGLSRYANKNLDEFMAEAYSEYKNNSKPREIARKVGQWIEEAYEEASKNEK